MDNISSLNNEINSNLYVIENYPLKEFLRNNCNFNLNVEKNNEEHIKIEYNNEKFKIKTILNALNHLYSLNNTNQKENFNNKYQNYVLNLIINENNLKVDDLFEMIMLYFY